MAEHNSSTYLDEIRNRVTILGMLIAKGQDRHNLELLRKGGVSLYSDYHTGQYFVFAIGPGLEGMERAVPRVSSTWGDGFWAWELDTLSEARAVFTSLCHLNKVSVWLIGPK